MKFFCDTSTILRIGNTTKVMIDPVQLWMGEGSSLRDIHPEDRIRLTSLLLGKIQNALLAD